MNDVENLNKPAAIAGIMTDTQACGFEMASDALTCSLLRTLVASKKSARILELGSGTGLSTAWLLDGMDSQSSLTTVDNDAELQAILSRHLAKDSRLSVVCADAGHYIASLKGQQFDLIFADTWAGKYHLLNDTLDLLASAGMYIIDDMLPRQSWPEGHAAKAANLINTLEQLDGFHITKMSWASGVIVVTKC